MSVNEDQVFSDHLKLVHFSLKKFTTVMRVERVDYEDLYQVGCIGLLRAVRRYDPSYNTTFSTFAVPAICNEIKQYLNRSSRLIKTSRASLELLLRIRKLSLLDTSPEVISEKLKCTVAHAEKALELQAFKVESFEQPFFTRNDKMLTVGETLPAFDDHTRLHVQEFVGVLSPREKETLLMRSNGATQQEIATALGLTQVSVCRILKRVGRKYMRYSVCS